MNIQNQINQTDKEEVPMGYKSIKENILSAIPNFEDFAEILSDGSTLFSTINKLREISIKNKLQSFVDSLAKVSNQEIKVFLADMKDSSDKKIMFIESLNKTINLNDDLQIYLLAYLTKNYQINGKLDYYEKQLFYTIETLSEDDLTIYYCFYLKNVLNNEKQRSFYIEYRLEHKEIIEIVLKKFIAIGFLKDNSNDTNFGFELNQFSSIFFKCLQGYFENNAVCDKWLFIDKNKPTDTTLNYSRYK
jgi:hypothetical protein